MTRPGLCVVPASRPDVPAPKAKLKSEESFCSGLWWCVTSDCTVSSLDGLHPDEWPPGIIFVKPGSMPRRVAAKALEAIAHELAAAGETH